MIRGRVHPVPGEQGAEDGDETQNRAEIHYEGRSKPAAATVAASDIDKMNQWNEKHPDSKFSWIVIDEKTPAAQKACRMCKKEFRDGRITRVDSKGASCGPKCHRAAFVNSEELMILTRSPREFLTIRAALRCWMNELDYHILDELRSYYPELATHTPMTADEVDAFLKNRMEDRP